MIHTFRLSRNTMIISDIKHPAVEKAIERFYRDIGMTMLDKNGEQTCIYLKKGELPRETYYLSFFGCQTMHLTANDALGFVYGLLYLSRRYLEIEDLWFWNEQYFKQKSSVMLPILDFQSEKFNDEYRVFSFNQMDEQLDKAGITVYNKWTMIIETVLRLNGNVLLLEKNDSNEPISRLAASCGLYVVDSELPGGINYSLPKREGKKMSFGKPVEFSDRVAREGNYAVSLRVITEKENSFIMIFAGRRQLKHIGIQSEKEHEYTFSLNISDYRNRGEIELTEDRTVGIQVFGCTAVSDVRINEISCPTIFIGGDSTVTEQPGNSPYYPCGCYCGWGQMITAYLNNNITICNQAYSGLTTETFRSEGYYDIVEKMMSAGDYLLLQFGHNDQKLEHLRACGGYKYNMLRFINEAEAKGVQPVLVTPLARNTWFGTTGKYNDLLKEYADCCLELGRERNIPVIDLHKMSMELIMREGLEASKKYFYPSDYTHTNDYGGYKIAGLIAEEIKKLGNLSGPGDMIKPNIIKSDRISTMAKLAKNIKVNNFYWETPEKHELPNDVKINSTGSIPEIFSKLITDGIENSDRILSRAEAVDLVVKRFNFFPTSVYNDRFDDIVGHEWYAGSVECAIRNLILTEEMFGKKNFYPDKAVTGEELTDMVVNAVRSRSAEKTVEKLDYAEINRSTALEYLARI